MIEPLKKNPFSHTLRHKRVILNFANADFTEKLWKTIEQDKKGETRRGKPRSFMGHKR